MKKIFTILIIVGLLFGLGCQTTKSPSGEIRIVVDNEAVANGVQQAIIAAQAAYDLYAQDQERREKLGEERYQRELERQQMYIDSLQRILESLQKKKVKTAQ